MPSTYWSPNQAAIAQVETYTFTTPNSIGNSYSATINGKVTTYSSISGDTAALAATGLFNLLNASTSITPELTEIQFANPSDGILTATARVAGTPFANVTIRGVTGQGLVLSTGNGLANGISTSHTTPNASPSDINDAQNWLRVTPPAAPTRSLPIAGDDVIVNNSNTPMLWNLDRLSSVRFNTYTRWCNFTGPIGLPDNNPGGYTEWRATYFKFSGPAGSVPAGGLSMILGYSSTQGGGGPSRERYDLGSDPVTLTILSAGSPIDDYGVRFLGVHTNNTFKLLGGVSLGVAINPGEVATLSSSSMDGSTLGVGPGVTWASNSTLTMYSGSVVLNSAPNTLNMNNGSQATFSTDGLTWPNIVAQGGCFLNWLAGGVITTLTLSTGCNLDKSQDGRALTITNSTLDGDSCTINDPLNAITFTNATSVKQQVSSGPIKFTGPRTMKVV